MMMRFGFIFLAISICLFSCSKSKEDEPVKGKLVITDDTISILDDDSSVTVSLSHTSSQSIGWSVSELPEWVSVIPSEGVTGTDDPVEITFSCVDDFDFSFYSTPEVPSFAQLVDDNGTLLNLSVQLIYFGTPQISLEPDTMILNEQNDYSGIGKIRNVGDGILLVLGLNAGAGRFSTVTSEIKPDDTTIYSARISDVSVFSSGIHYFSHDIYSNSGTPSSVAETNTKTPVIIQLEVP